LRHKKIKPRNSPIRIVELCPLCNNGMAPYFNKESGTKGKICHDCNYIHIDFVTFKEEDFIVYGE